MLCRSIPVHNPEPHRQLAVRSLSRVSERRKSSKDHVFCSEECYFCNLVLRQVQEDIERERALHLEADAASVISCREGKPDFVKPYSTCVAQIVEICEASSQLSQIWSCISASVFCHSQSAAQHNVTSCNHHTNRIPCLDSLKHYGW